MRDKTAINPIDDSLIINAIHTRLHIALVRDCSQSRSVRLACAPPLRPDRCLPPHRVHVPVSRRRKAAVRLYSMERIYYYSLLRQRQHI